MANFSALDARLLVRQVGGMGRMVVRCIASTATHRIALLALSLALAVLAALALSLVASFVAFVSSTLAATPIQDPLHLVDRLLLLLLLLLDLPWLHRENPTSRDKIMLRAAV